MVIKRPAREPDEWTVEHMKEIAAEYRHGQRVEVSRLDYPEMLSDLDEYVFKPRPDLVLDLSSIYVEPGARGGAGLNIGDVLALAVAGVKAPDDIIEEATAGFFARKHVPYSDAYLSAISAMRNVRKVSMSSNHQEDINALKTLPLTNLRIIGRFSPGGPQYDLGFLQHFHELEYLILDDGDYKGFEAIPGLSSLRTLVLDSIALPETAFLQDLHLDYLKIFLKPFADNGNLSPLAGADIHTFVFSDPDYDLRFLEGATSLRRLSIKYSDATELIDFSALRSLEELHLSKMKSLENIESLASASSLKTLFIHEPGKKITPEDFKVILRMPRLERLYLWGKDREDDLLIEAVQKMLAKKRKKLIFQNSLLEMEPGTRPR
jgi:hypothetical protein